jgi:hypothetical protein
VSRKKNSTKNKKTLEVFHFSGAGGCRVDLRFDAFELFLEAVSFFLVHFVAVVIHACHVCVCVCVCVCGWVGGWVCVCVYGFATH